MSKVNNLITDLLIEKLEEAIESGKGAPWRKPYNGGQYKAPRSLNTGKTYRGINNLLLSLTPYGSEYWLTFKQIKARGGSIKKGEGYMPVVFFKWLEKEGDAGEKESIPMLRFYKVWNVEQCEGIDYEKPEQIELKDHERIEAAEAVVLGYAGKPKIEHSLGGSPCYNPRRDTVFMPELGQFETPEKYYAVLFHELVHSTGHENRLNRATLTNSSRFGNHQYSREELVAELGAAMLCQRANISNDELQSNTVAYLRSWIKVLKDDVTMAVAAGQQAQKGVDLVLNEQYQAAAKAA